MKRFRMASLAAAAMVFGFATVARADIMGPFNVANCPGGGVTVTGTQIIWSPSGTQPDTGCVDTGIGTNVTYSGGTLGPGVQGDIKNLTLGGGVVPAFMTFPAPGPAALRFDLTGFSIPNPTLGTNCAAITTSGQSCVVIPGSPFLLTFLGVVNGRPTTVIGLGAGGIVSDGSGSTANWGGGFSTQINDTPAGIQATFFATGSIASTHSGQFTISPIPEPATVFLLGSGLLGIGVILRRRRA